LRNRELEAQKYSKPQTWRNRQIADKGKPSADINVVFTSLVAPLGYEWRKHKCLCSEIVKGVTKVDDGHQHQIQAIGSKDVS
jgi:hypothetical protein